MAAKNLDLHALFSLQGKVALVTGGSRGIGLMMAQGLLQAGAKVYITARKAQACQEAAQQLSQYGECIAVPADVVDAQDRKLLCEELTEKEQQLHILVNNAGTAWGGDYEFYPEDSFGKVMDVNVTAVFALTRDVTPLLEAAASLRDPARVINIGSMEGLHIPTVHRTGNYAYTVSKAAVHHLTRHLAVELGERNITVNAIAPGFFPSKMTEYVLENRGEDCISNSLIKRLGEEEDIAGTLIYLAGRAGAYTHGVIIPVDGGTSINHQHVKD
jgi:NAD(P)-dependent dehydrogenase (short-subunit alcohol dehydrogenase family)